MTFIISHLLGNASHFLNVRACAVSLTSGHLKVEWENHLTFLLQALQYEPYQIGVVSHVECSF